jgi:hypothetical protein
MTPNVFESAVGSPPTALTVTAIRASHLVPS